MNKILCCKCGQEMKRSPRSDFRLPQTGYLVKGYSCPTCGNTDSVANVKIEASVDEVIDGLRRAMKSVGERGKVVFEQVEHELTWTIEIAAEEL